MDTTKFLQGYKTYILAAVTIVYAIAGIAMKQSGGSTGLDPQTGINLIIGALFGTTFRSALNTQATAIKSTMADVGEKVSVAVADKGE